MWWLWLMLMIAVLGYFIYRVDKKIKVKFQDKFNPQEWDLPRSVELTAEIKPHVLHAQAPGVKLGYTKKSSIFTDTRRHIFNALQQALDGDYILLANIKVADVLVVDAKNNALAGSDLSSVQIATRNIAVKEFDFLVCDKTQLTPVCAVVLGNLEPLLVNACETAQLPLARFNIQAGYDVTAIRESLLKALGRTEIPTSTYESALEIADVTATTKSEQNVVAVTEEKSSTKMEPINSEIKIELCPECSAVMLRRKAKSGAAAGQLFWICSTYPKCRKMVPIK